MGIVVAGAIPAGATKLMIVPYQAQSATVHYELPYGATVALVDSTTGTVDIITGQVTLESDNPTGLVDDDRARRQIQLAIADTIEGVDASMVRIVDIVLARRLAEASVPRALQGNVAITYEI